MLGQSNLYQGGLLRSSVFFSFASTGSAGKFDESLWQPADCSKDVVWQGQLSSSCLLSVFASLQFFLKKCTCLSRLRIGAALAHRSSLRRASENVRRLEWRR